LSEVKRFLEELKKDPYYSDRIVHIEKIPERKSRHAEVKKPFPEVIRRYLSSSKIEKLYLHQAKAIDAVREGKNVVVTSSTGSGKSLIYNLCVWEAIIKDPTKRALYLFPTKALTQDQLDGIIEFTSFFPDLKITSEIYDGDTSSYRRKNIKKRVPHILLTNPDMLQMGILPFHSSWKDFFSCLSFIVLDEIHTYRGIFGTHVAHILRRLRRILNLYSSKVQFIASSATIDDAACFARELVGEKFFPVSEDGSPSPKKYFLLWKAKASPYSEACHIFLKCIDEGLRTILFTKSRRATELISFFIKEMRPELSSKVAPYRAGYLPSERRDIERKLFEGKLLGIISTSALELGIDVGNLDCCILLGYPGTSVSTWQRAGRVGRGQRDALIIMVGLEDALDQYFLRHPREFFSRGWEKMIINTKNEPITLEHLPCAASEYPLSEDDERIYGESFFPCLKALEREGKLLKDREAKRWYARRRYPQRRINIRSIGETYSIIDLKTGKVMGDVDETRVYRECHPGAIYLHHFKEYEIVQLDEISRCVYAQRRDVGYYTQASSWEKIEIITPQREKDFALFKVRLGKVKVTERIVGFEKRRKSDQSLISEHQLNLPAKSFETISLWLEVPFEMAADMRNKGLDLAGSLHALEHAVIAIFPLKVSCDRQDLGGRSFLFHDQTMRASVFIYDSYPGGAGLVERGFELFVELLESCLNLIKECPCTDGCPSCIQSPNCGSGNRTLDKRGAIFLLEHLLSSKKPRVQKELKPLVLSRKTFPEKESRKRTKNILFLDIETQRSAEEVGGWQNKHLMRVSIAVTYSMKKGKFKVFTEENIEELFQELLRAELVVGFNIKGFDYQVLSYYGSFDFSRIPTLDILEEVVRYLGFRLSLEHLCQVTLGFGKLGNGLDAIRWFEEGNMGKLIQYCKRDVELVRRLYEYGRENGYLLFKDKEERVLRIPVSW